MRQRWLERIGRATNERSKLGDALARIIILYGGFVWVVGALAASPAHCAKTSSDAALITQARRSKQMFEDEEAINFYSQYLKAHPDNEQVRAERADVLKNEGRYAETISDYQILLKSKNPAIASTAAADVGKFYQKTKKYPEAIQNYKIARKLGFGGLLTEISDCARLSGDYETALQYSNEIIKSGNQFQGKLHRANAYLAMNKPKLALDDVTSLVDSQRKYIASLDKESRAIYPAVKDLIEALDVRTKCYEALKQPNLAQEDKKSVRAMQQEFYNESPFLTKDRH